MTGTAYIYAHGNGHHPRMPHNVIFERVEVRIGIRVREEAGLRLHDEAIDASDVTHQRSHEQRSGSIQEQGARQEYPDGCIAESLAAEAATMSDQCTGREYKVETIHQKNYCDNYEQGQNACNHTGDQFDCLVSAGDNAPKRALERPMSRAV